MSEQAIKEIIERSKKGHRLSERHHLTLYAIALASRGKTFVELGIRDGGSTLPLLMAAKEVGATLYSVDIEPITYKPPDELLPYWRPIKKDAISFLSEWKTPKMDFVFVDDWHAYDHVKKELRLLDHTTTPSSVILLHDLMYLWSEPDYHTNPGMWKGIWAKGGPYRAVKELNNRKWEWATLPWGHGLTLLRKRGKLLTESRMKMFLKRYAPKSTKKLREYILKPHAPRLVKKLRKYLSEPPDYPEYEK